MTLAGTLVQLNAEQLSGIVLTQLVRPGTPVLAGYIFDTTQGYRWAFGIIAALMVAAMPLVMAVRRPSRLPS